MPALPHRRDRRRARSWTESRIERWEPPRNTARDLIGVAVLGFACVGLAWVIVTAAGMLS
jgi:hypothetical protein